MSAETPSQGRGGLPARGGDLRRTVLLVLGAALAAFGARVRAGTVLRIAPRIDPSSVAGTTAAVIITVTAGALVVTVGAALVRRRRRGRRRDELPRAAPPLPGTPLTRLLMGLTAVALMLAPVAAVIFAAAHQGRDTSITVPAGPIGAPPSVSGPHSAGRGAPLDTAGRDVALLVAAGVLVGAASWKVLRPRRAGPTGLADPAVAEAQLVAAVKAATQALQEASAGDPRQAVIDCYSAMEQSLAGTLTLRRPTDTPQELLRRARGSGVLHGEEAQRLTALFERARFSHRPLDEHDRAAAAQALVRVQRELTVR